MGAGGPREGQVRMGLPGPPIAAPVLPQQGACALSLAPREPIAATTVPCSWRDRGDHRRAAASFTGAHTHAQSPGWYSQRKILSKEFGISCRGRVPHRLPGREAHTARVRWGAVQLGARQGGRDSGPGDHSVAEPAVPNAHRPVLCHAAHRRVQIRAPAERRRQGVRQAQPGASSRQPPRHNARRRPLQFRVWQSLGAFLDAVSDTAIRRWDGCRSWHWTRAKRFSRRRKPRRRPPSRRRRRQAERAERAQGAGGDEDEGEARGGGVGEVEAWR